MALDKPYQDVPGTIIFDAEQSRKGYWLNQFCMSLMKAENRERFKADERAYLDREHENTSVGTLLFNDDLDAPIEQHNDLAELQGAHDLGEIDHLGRLLTRLEEKYA